MPSLPRAATASESDRGSPKITRVPAGRFRILSMPFRSLFPHTFHIGSPRLPVRGRRYGATGGVVGAIRTRSGRISPLMGPTFSRRWPWHNDITAREAEKGLYAARAIGLVAAHAPAPVAHSRVAARSHARARRHPPARLRRHERHLRAERADGDRVPARRAD